MSAFGKKGDGPRGRRWLRRKKVGIPASALFVGGSRSVLVEDLSMTGARLRGRDLPLKGTILLKAGERSLFGEIAWEAGEHRGLQFDFARR